MIKFITAYFQDPSGNKIIVKNLKVNIQDVNARPPQPTLARKMLNDSVASGICDRISTIHLGINIIRGHPLIVTTFFLKLDPSSPFREF